MDKSLLARNLVKCVTLIALISILFCSCSYNFQDSVLFLCGSYGVPGMFCFERRGGTYSCNVIEEDEQGRLLFEYTAKSVITNKKETVLVICQSFDSEYVYYYEDQCYLLAEYDESELIIFKEQNDWGKELDTEKMSKRKLAFDFNSNIVSESTPVDYYQQVLAACSSKLSVESSALYNHCFVDEDAAGNRLIWLSVDTVSTSNMYLVLVSPTYNVEFFTVADGAIDSVALADFKKENGWMYG